MARADNGDGHIDIDWQPVDHYPAATREMIARRTTAPASYEAYYGLAEPPFSLSPTVRFAFRSGSYATALDQVRRALERREGFIVITGEVGTGKSMLCRAAMQNSGPNTFVSLILDPCVTAEELLAQVLSDFGVLDRDARSPRRVAPAPLHQLIVVLQRFLSSLAPLGGRAVVIIDEAQHLHPVLLEQLRLWSNLDGDGPPLLQVVLSGQPELDTLLGRPEMRQVRQRVARRCELTGLERAEVVEYIDHRLAVARGPDTQQAPGPAGVLTQGEFWRVQFSPSAVRTVAALSQGVPRVVNLLADRALEVGCERQARTIDARIVREAARRFESSAGRHSAMADAGCGRGRGHPAARRRRWLEGHRPAQSGSGRRTTCDRDGCAASAGDAGDQNAGRSRQRHRDDRHAAIGAARGSCCGAAC
jgi:general secretion pathway protein A